MREKQAMAMPASADPPSVQLALKSLWVTALGFSHLGDSSRASLGPGAGKKRGAPSPGQ